MIWMSSIVGRLFSWLGLKRYVVRWEFPSRTVPGRVLRGEGLPMLSKRKAKHVAAIANARFSGRHWVEEV